MCVSVCVLGRLVMSDSLRPMDCNLQASSIHGIVQARILEWFALSFYRGSSWPRDQTPVCCIAGRYLPSELPWKPHIYVYTHTHTHTMYMYICTYMHIHVCICVYTHVYVTCVHMYIYICVYMYVCTYMYMYNVYIHTHTHIYNWITLLYARN